MFVSQHDPFRPVDWRYRRAEYLRVKGKYRRKFANDDGYIQLTKKFLAAKEKATCEYDLEKISVKMPGLFYASEIYQRVETSDKYILEARILADTPIAEIAHKHEYSPEVIFWYEKIFFDVRAKLDKRDYIISRVLGPAVHRGLMARDFDLLLKIYALIGGPLVVDALVEQRSGSIHRPKNEKELDLFFNNDTASTIKRNAAIAARCTHINRDSISYIMESHQKMLDLERQTETSVDTSNLIMQNINATLQSIPFHTPAKRVVSKTLSEYDKMGVELRASEMAVAGVDNDPGVQGELEYYKFPEITPGE